MITIAIIIGSGSDLKQCRSGFKWLSANDDKIFVKKIFIASQHRHTLKVQDILVTLVDKEIPPDAIIIGAGWANHLTGCCDAFLRYTLKNTRTNVVGVAFDDLSEKSNPEERYRHNQAAVLSITEVPGTKVIFKDKEGQFFGEDGFLRACKLVAMGELPEIILKPPPEAKELTLDDALELAN